MDAPAEPRRFPAWTPPLAVALATAVAFLPSLRGEFLNWDDDYNFLFNPNYRGLSPNHLRWMFSTFALGHYHPLTWLTLGLDYTIWGMNPFGYHLTSLLIHAASAALLYRVLESLLKIVGRPEPRWPAVAGALFYSLHPLRVESVAWITERRDVLCGFFTLLCLLAYLRRVRDERDGKPSTRWFLLSLAAFAASLLSKALSITLPAVLLILDVAPLGRFKPGDRRRILLEKLPFLLLSCVDAAVMFSAMRDIDAVHATASYNLLQRMAQAAYGLCFYGVKTVWPSGLAPLYRLEPHLDPADPWNLASMAAVAGLSVFLLVRRKALPGPLAAWLAYGALVFPVLGVAVTGMQVAADRYTYLAALPVSVLIAGGLPRRRELLPAAVAVLSLLAALTVRQCGYWRDSVTLWTREIEIDPRCAVAYGNRGQARLARREWAAALSDYDQRAAIEAPTDPKFWHNHGIARAMLEDHPAAQADFTRALELDADYVDARVSRALSRATTGDVAGAEADLDEALRRDPRRFDAWRQRGRLRTRSNPRGAIADYSRALELRPDLADTWVDRGLLRAVSGDTDGARQDFESALRVAPPDWPRRRKAEEYLERTRRPQ